MALKIILLHNTLTKRELEGCAHYIFASLKECTRETGKNLFHFVSKALLILGKSNLGILDIQVS